MKLPRFLSPVMIGIFAIIVLQPIIYMLTAPFFAGGSGQDAVGLSFFDQRHFPLARNSLSIALGTTGLALIIGVPLAFLLSRTDLRGRKVFTALAIVPVLIPPYIHAIVWNHAERLTRSTLPLHLHSVGGVVLVLALAYFPFVTLLTMSGLRAIDRNKEEASLLCRGRWQTVARITLPQVTPHILSSVIFVFIFAIIDFGVPDILRVNVYPVEIFIQFTAFYDERSATVLSLPLLFITFLLIVFHQSFMKDRSYISLSGGRGRSLTFSLGRTGILAYFFVFAILTLAVVIPVAVLLFVSGSFSNYIKVLRTSTDQIMDTFLLALGGALLTVVLSFFLSAIIERSNRRVTLALLCTTLLPLAIPAITLGIGLIKVWNRPFIGFAYGSSLMIIFGYVARFIPFCIMTTISGMKQISSELEEAAALVTSRWSRIAGRILLPLLSRSLVTGFFVVYILSLGELGTTLLVIPPGRETIPIKIYNLMHYGAEQMVAALCLMLVGMILGFSGLFLWIQSRLAKSVNR